MRYMWPLYGGLGGMEKGAATGERPYEFGNNFAPNNYIIKSTHIG